MAIPFADLKLENESIRDQINAAVQRVLDSGWYILGTEVEAFEEEFSDFLGVTHTVGVASGTEAIQLALLAAGIGPGDEVIAPANTCMPTIVGIQSTGATAVLADVDLTTFTICPKSIKAVLSDQTKAIVPVHLYGHPCDMDAINAIAKSRGLIVVEDCAQAHGARYKGNLCGTLGDLAAFSFYPSKNLGAIGDGGAVTTLSDTFFERLTRLRNYGQSDRYTHHTTGINSRLDEMQAAILRVKLKYLTTWNGLRQSHAISYANGLKNLGLILPTASENIEHSFHLYVVRHESRNQLKEYLMGAGIGTQIHYPIPVHEQPVMQDAIMSDQDLPNATRLSKEILSLPLQPLISEDSIEKVIDSIASFFHESG